MKHISRGIALLALAGGIAIVRADEAKDMTKRVQAGMNDFTKAVMRKDYTQAESVLKANFSPKFVYTRANGETMKLNDWLAQMKVQFAMLKSVSKMSMTISNVKVTGNKATSKETFVMVATMPNMQDPKKTSKLEVNSTSSSVWEKTAKGWMCISSKDLNETVKIDGKPMKM
ncbi:MAG TPA: nuclear transport factor 2 family protein [Fimbriimonadaceae bacterium]|nr:nuclear transport factor 2 family protein [Fimbriimonadaceae bacterium]